MLIALDPNVFLAAAHKHGYSQDLLDEVFEARDYVQLAVDKEQRAILEDYHEILPILGEDQRKYLQELLNDSRIEMIPAPIDSDRDAYLASKGCGTPVEPQLIMVCTKPGWDVPILVVGQDFTHPDLSCRGIHDPVKVAELSREVPELKGLTVFTALEGTRHIHDRVSSGLPYPYNLQELERFLRVRGHREGDQLEFKQPDQDPECQQLTRSILQKSMQPLCAFANTYGGAVLVGVHENKKTGVGEIRGFPLRYQGKPKTEDQVLRMLYDDPLLLDTIQPRLSKKLRAHFVNLPDKNSRRVLILSVMRCDGPPRRHYGKIYYRDGTENRSEG